MPQELIVACKYGWGQQLRLYRNHLDLNGSSYVLHDLIYVQRVCNRLLGISSARLELQFRDGLIILRGIADLDAALRIVVYVNSWKRLRANQPTSLLDAAAVSLALQEASKRSDQFAEVPESGGWDRRGSAASTPLPVASASLGENGPFTGMVSIGPYQPYAQMLIERGQWSSSIELQAQRIDRLKRLRAERSRRQHGFDVEQLAQFLQRERLPQVLVSPRLHPGEIAHYCTEAELCDELSREPPRYKNRVKDQGMLILTNQRMIYLGRKRQIALKYEHLLYYVQVDGMVALLAEHWTVRQLFNMRYPLECIMYLEAILKIFQASILNTAFYADSAKEVCASFSVCRESDSQETYYGYAEESTGPDSGQFEKQG